MDGSELPSGGFEIDPRDLILDQGMGDLATATEQYFRRLIDFLDTRINALGGAEAECAAPLVSARAAAEIGLRASEKLAGTIAKARR